MMNNAISKVLKWPAGASASAALLLFELASGSAGAQTSPPDAEVHTAQLEEIVVTAQKRRERLQDVPVAVTAITAEAAAKQGITGTMDLPVAVPGLAFHRSANMGNIFLRGVGSTSYGPAAEHPVAVFVDGVYISSPENNMFEFNNIERIEVLKGPQGTLFGRNTTGGVIQIITKDPSLTPSADLEVGYANYETVSASGYATAGITDTLAFDVAARYLDQGEGWGRNITTGTPNFQQDDNFSTRSKWLWMPGESTEVRFAVDYAEAYSTDMYRIPRGGSYIDGGPFPGRFNARAGTDEYQELNTGGASVHVEHDFGALRFVSITSYRDWDIDYFNDQDKTPVPALGLHLLASGHDWTQELQLQSDADSAIKWVVGAFYFGLRGGFDSFVVTRPPLGQLVIGDDLQRTESYAAFGQATAPIFSATNLTLGLRYTTEDQRFTVGSFNAFGTALALEPKDQDASEPTWRVSIDHHFSPDVMGYVSYNRGFKSGGFNPLAPLDPPYQPEILDSYEVGLKSELLDRRLRLNGTAFYYDYNNIQVGVPTAGSGIIQNAAAARVKGFEADFQAMPFDDLTISGGFTFLDAQYTKFPRGPVVSATGVTVDCDADPAGCNLAGNELNGAPDFAGSISADYLFRTALGDIRPSVALLYTGGYFFYPDNRLENPTHKLLNAAIAWTSLDEKYSVRLWGKNLNDAEYWQSAAESAFHDQVRPAAPRTYGITLGARF